MVKIPISIKSILIANRGEIAVRLIATVKRMGIRAIAVYSSADKNALHVTLADEAVMIGPGPAPQSYLSIENIIQAARDSGADAIHPGYGFLSENAAFALRCEREGIHFIGPAALTMEIMGDKASAKIQARQLGIACIHGDEGAQQSNGELLKAGEKIGFPLMIKAAGGGGGRGMRLVRHRDKFETALDEARSEALGGFGTSKLILEKAIDNARHIEFQILGDAHGHIIHLGERDCSLQRRHQKVIEEAPSPAVNDELREVMGNAAVILARSVAYKGAGTVEFLLDEANNFYFLEMNTRLQVEHGVTELITGIDLVEWQIRIERGEPLGIQQQDVRFCGHAIQARLYAEDPANGFLPSTGKIEKWKTPVTGKDDYCNLRIDSAIVEGDEISPHYDAMVAKIIVHCDAQKDGGNDNTTAGNQSRQSARTGLIDALEKTVFLGPRHNKDFLRELLNNKNFINANATINLIENEFGSDRLAFRPPHIEIVVLAATLEFSSRCEKSLAEALFVPRKLLGWSSSPLPGTSFRYKIEESEFELLSRAVGDGEYRIECGGQLFDVKISDNHKNVVINGNCHLVDAFVSTNSRVLLAAGGRDYEFVDLNHNHGEAKHIGQNSGGNIVLSAMHGVLVEVSVNIGTSVTSETKLGVLEAMKMRHEIVAGTSGMVKSIFAQAGAQVAAGEKLFEIDSVGEGEDDAAGE